MHKYKLHTYIFEAATDEEAVARIKMASPETDQGAIRFYMYKFDIAHGCWFDLPGLRPAFVEHGVRRRLFDVCTSLASKQILMNLKGPQR